MTWYWWALIVLGICGLLFWAIVYSVSEVAMHQEKEETRDQRESQP